MSTSIEDLLSEDYSNELSHGVIDFHKNKTILISGAGGTIGFKLAKRLTELESVHLILLDHSEYALFEIQEYFYSLDQFTKFNFELGDICDIIRMNQIFEKYRPDIVYHAAAFKHVGIMEQHPYEAVKVNVYGTKILADVSIKYKVEKFVFISTDKAVNPVGVLGYSKKIAELYLQMIQSKQTHFVITRFGNVIGSSGSLIPKIQKQIKKGGPITITDKKAERFFMTKSSACKLVLEVGVIGQNKDVFLFDMGKPFKIIDVIEQLIYANKMNSEADLKIVVEGLQEGEKLKEELYEEGEFLEKTAHPKILKLKKTNFQKEEVLAQINLFCERSRNGEVKDYKQEFKNICI